MKRSALPIAVLWFSLTVTATAGGCSDAPKSTGPLCLGHPYATCTCPNGLPSTAPCGEDGHFLACLCGDVGEGDAAVSTEDALISGGDIQVAPGGDATVPGPDAAPSASPGGCPAAPDLVSFDAFEMFRFEASHPTATAVEAYPGDVTAPAEPAPACSVMFVRPWHSVTWAAAGAACEKAGFRLCKAAELLRACGGPDGRRWTFGGTFNDRACNLRQVYMAPGAAQPSEAPCGGFEDCVSAEGVYDLTGNLWEWVQERPDYVGAGWRLIAEQHRDEDLVCTAAISSTPDFDSTDVGFRCCRDK